MDIFGPLPVTTKGIKYIFSLQDRLNSYSILIPMKNKTTESINTGLIEHYIYILGAPKKVTSEQGRNFLADLMQQFETALNIQHIKTTSLHPAI